MRETFTATMDTSQLSSRRGIFLTRTTLIILAGLIFSTLFAVGLIVYNVSCCSDSPDAAAKLNGNHCSSSNGGQPDFVTAAITTGDASSSLDDVTNNGVDVNGALIQAPTISGDVLSSTTGSAVASKFDGRLPRSVVPVSYDIQLVPFLIENNFTFNGEVSIVVDIVEDCSNITLHVAAITVHDVKLNAIDDVNTSISVVDKRVDTAKQFLIIETGSELTKGSQYRLYIKYEGVLNEYLQGFYRSSYRIGNDTRYGLPAWDTVWL